MSKKFVIGMCGIHCHECKNYKINANCQGCHTEKELLEDCPTRVCCAEKNIKYCSRCNTFPCADQQEFYKVNQQRKKGYDTMVKDRITPFLK